jgi:hypothetical protein
MPGEGLYDIEEIVDIHISWEGFDNWLEMSVDVR